MANEVTIQPKSTALLVMDYQTGVISDPSRKAALQKAVLATKVARAAGIPIIYGVIRFDEGYPVTPARNWSFTSFQGGGKMRRGGADAEIHPDIAPQKGDVVIERKRSCIFTATDLDLVLRAKNIDTIALFGISTSGQVLSAVRVAVDLDYRLFVLSDCCADRDEEVNRVLMTKVLPMHSKVISAEAFIEALRSHLEAADR